MIVATVWRVWYGPLKIGWWKSGRRGWCVWVDVDETKSRWHRIRRGVRRLDWLVIAGMRRAFDVEVCLRIVVALFRGWVFLHRRNFLAFCYW